MLGCEAPACTMELVLRLLSLAAAVASGCAQWHPNMEGSQEDCDARCLDTDGEGAQCSVGGAPGRLCYNCCSQL